MSETKPTAGALRAAMAWIEHLRTATRTELCSVNKLAQIIDRETAGPKVEELVSLLLAWLDNQPDGRGEVELRVLAKAREVESALGGKAE